MYMRGFINAFKLQSDKWNNKWMQLDMFKSLTVFKK